MNFQTDRFLDGRLLIKQPVNGYRAGADPVLLAAAVPAKPGQTVLELGCGSGVAMACLKHRVPEVSVVGVEREPISAALSRENLVNAGIEGIVVEADLAQLPAELLSCSFDHVMANPPFFDRQAGTAANDGSREAGRGINTPLKVWVDTAIRRLKPKGSLTLVHRVEALPDILGAIGGRLGAITVLPLAPRAGRDAKLLIVQALKGRRSPFRISAPFVLHDGDQHMIDGESYSAAAKAILRDGKGFDPQLLSLR